MKILSIKKVEKEPVFDFTVKDAHHYILENGVITHNSGLEYAASTIVFLSKKKEKLNDEVVGNIVKCRLQKSRLTIADKVVETLLRYDSGVDKYYGLLDIGIKAGVFKKVSTRYELPDGTKAFEKNILESPEKYYTKDILDKIDEYCKKEFLYGSKNESREEGNEEGDKGRERDEIE
jgi:hypothetical protein